MKLKVIFIAFVCVASGLFSYAQKGSPINIMTYNIRYNNKGDGINAWPNRKDLVKAQVQFYDTDILCVQEALAGQFEDILAATDFKAEGVGRDDGKRKGEFSAIFYNKNRFLRKDGGTFWLSPTPDVPGKGWDAVLPRICTWVRLYDKQNKKEFMVFNTHYDHVGVQSRIQAALLIKQKIQEIAPKLPVVFTGDLNVTPETEAIATIKSFLTDARDVSAEPPYGPLGTFNNFKYDSELKEKIDYIFINQGFKVQKFATLTDHKDRRYFSDHLPLFARLFLN